MPYVQGDPFEAETISQAREAIADGLDAALEREPEVAQQWMGLVDSMVDRATRMEITWTPAHTDGVIFILTSFIESIGNWYAGGHTSLPDLDGKVFSAFVDLATTGAETALLLERRTL